MALLHSPDDAARITAWRCIGCGKIDAPQPCIGVCRDQKVELVDSTVYDELRARHQRLLREHEALMAFAQLVAGSTPHRGRWEESYRNIKERAQQFLASRREIASTDT